MKFQEIIRNVINGYRPEIPPDVPNVYREMIERCWSQQPENRPSFDEIVEDLKTNPDFMTNSIDESEFYDYVDYIKSAVSSFDKSQQMFHFDDFIKAHGRNKSIQKVKIMEIKDQIDLINVKSSSYQDKAPSNENTEVDVPDLNHGEADDKSSIKEKKSPRIIENNHEQKEEVNEKVHEEINEKVHEEVNKKVLEEVNEKVLEEVNEKVLEEDAEKVHKEVAEEIHKEVAEEIHKEVVEEIHKEVAEEVHEEKQREFLLFLSEFNDLSTENKNLVLKAKNDNESQCLVGKYLIDGSNGFPQNISYGKQYIDKSFSDGCLDAIVYRIRMILKGKLIEFDLQEAKRLLKKVQECNDPRLPFLFGKILLKEDQFKNALDIFKQGASGKNSECMYEYAKMLFLGKGTKRDVKESIKYFNISKEQNFKKSELFLLAYQELSKIKKFDKLPADTQLIFISNSIKKIDETQKSKIGYIFDQIEIKYIKTEMLFFNKSLNNSNFHKVLKNYKDITIDIQYPSESFESIISLVTKIQNKIIKHIKISIIFSSIDHFRRIRQYKEINRIYSYSLGSSIDTIPEEIFNDFISLPQMRTIISPSVIKIDKYAFFFLKSLVEISIPSSVTKIGNCAFAQCSSLAQVTIPSSIIIIGDSAFDNCTSLSKVSLPCYIRKIGNSIFNECSKLTEIEIRKSVNQDFAGLYCDRDYYPKLDYFQMQFLISKSTAESSYYDVLLFSRYDTKEISIPSFIKEIGYSAFESHKITKITIPSSVTKICVSAFKYCTSLKEIFIPCSVTVIEYCCFENCYSLAKISFESPSSLKKIGKSAFNGCSSLIQLSIPSSVTNIGDSAFSGCTSLEEITFHSFVAIIGNGILSKCFKLNKINILNVENKSNLSYIDDKFLIWKSAELSNCNVLIFSQPNIENLTLSSFIHHISDSVFEYYTSLTQITIPSSVTKIGPWAFDGCKSLKQVKFETPSSITKIEFSTFSNCTSLAQIEIPSSVKIIERNSFEHCESLKQISIPSSVVEIENDVFIYCKSLEQISILSSVVEIGYSAFYQCTSLKQITIPAPLKAKLSAFESNVKIITI